MHPDITDYVDGSLNAGDRAAIDRHLEDCPACRALVADVRELQRAAAALEPMQPPARAWARIHQSIVDSHQSSVDGPPDRLRQGYGGPPKLHAKAEGGHYVRKVRGWGWLAAAAGLALAVAGGLWITRAPRGGEETTPTTAAETASGQAIEAEVVQAEQHYQKAIEGLEQIASTGNSALDPGTAATLQKNLAVVDQAIGESRAALRAQPDSGSAQHSLLDSFKAKVALLQDTVALINEMRKGNAAGTAQIVSGMKRGT